MSPNTVRAAGEKLLSVILKAFLEHTCGIFEAHEVFFDDCPVQRTLFSAIMHIHYCSLETCDRVGASAAMPPSI